MGYKPENIFPTAGSCHFILNANYADKSVNLIFFLNVKKSIENAI